MLFTGIELQLQEQPTYYIWLESNRNNISAKCGKENKGKTQNIYVARNQTLMMIKDLQYCAYIGFLLAFEEAKAA